MGFNPKAAFFGIPAADGFQDAQIPKDKWFSVPRGIFADAIICLLNKRLAFSALSAMLPISFFEHSDSSPCSCI